MIRFSPYTKCKTVLYAILFLGIVQTLTAGATAATTIGRTVFAPGPPTVTSPIYYCQGSTPSPLTATPSPGATLNWYGTNATGGTASAIAPTPSTATVGDTTYYVSQTDATGESVRVPIVVKVSTNTGSVNLFCDGAQTTATNVAFDWSNVPNYLGYHYSYSINGGPLVTGYQVSPSHFNVPVSGPGISVTFTIISVDNVPCAPSETQTCHSTCAGNITPTFNSVVMSYCQNAVPVALPTTSSDSPGITGTWSPATVSTATVGTQNYTFTPDAILFPCAVQKTITITTLAKPTPTFAAIPATICQNATAPLLATTSTNGITGTWSPAVINTATLGPKSYTFTPTAGQCVSSTPVVVNLTVTNNVTPTFAQIGPICSGSTPVPSLPATSVNGITGTWLPATVSNTSSSIYTFTPNTGQCATTTTMNINVTPSSTTVFNNFASNNISFCSGSTVPVLPPTSSNGISGTWNPATVSSTADHAYVFTPNAGQCATSYTLNVDVTAPASIQFDALPTAFSICVGTVPPPLSTTSSNGITGTWNAAAINTATPAVRTYTFTATPGQCVNTVYYTIMVDVTPKALPIYGPILPFCEGSIPPEGLALPTTINGIVGSWTPHTSIDNATPGHFIYTFTPVANQCAEVTTLVINVTQKDVTDFTLQQIAPFCAGTTPVPTLPVVSDNGITGTWLPAVIDNTINSQYTFIPDAGQCATNATMFITVIQPTDPGFEDLILCENDLVPALEPISPSGVSGTWSPAVIDPAVNGATYNFTADAGQCAMNDSITVTFNPVTLNDVSWTVSNYFEEDATVVITATDPGNYLYQLDFGPLYPDNVFHHVSHNAHTITVYDANGCTPPITKDIQVIDYPHFFTPNGDGVNDTWNIFDLRKVGQPDATIYIFDRYGKFLKQIIPAGLGWDGTYNGQPLPSSDYWFSVKYSELGIQREFKAHFSLKR